MERTVGGIPARIVGTVVDVTKDEETRLQLQMAATVYARAGEAIVITDANNRILAVNEKFSEFTGYSPEEAIGQMPTILNSNRQDEAFYQQLWNALKTQGHWRGEIWNRRKNGELFPGTLSITVEKDAAGQTMRHVAIFSDVTTERAKEELIERQTLYDQLTDLPNRRLFQEELAREFKHAQRHSSQFAVMLLDVDHFKDINNSMGHEVGDKVLVQVANRMAAHVRSADLVARYSGDDFAIVVRRIDDATQDATMAQKIIDAVARPIQIDNQNLSLTVSIGIAAYPQDSQDVTELMSFADRAMNVAKAGGGNRFHFYTPSMDKLAMDRARMLSELRRALDENEFELWYQPVIVLADGRIGKAEALIRWRHPTRGIVGPNEFIPLAEESGLIVEIGEWVFREVCQFIQHQASAMPATKIRIAFNLSARHLHEAPIDDQWCRYVADHGIDASQLIIEVTESAFVENLRQAKQRLNGLANAGFGLAIDDFGTGYSAMSYLKMFPFTMLKIDRSFIADVLENQTDQSIVEAIMAMAHRLNLHVIAEGVETAGQLAYLRERGCDYAQGYYFAKPMPRGDVVRLLQSSSARLGLVDH